MEPIKVTTSFKWFAADIMAELTNEGGVMVWFQLNDIGNEDMT